MVLVCNGEGNRVKGGTFESLGVVVDKGDKVDKVIRMGEKKLVVGVDTDEGHDEDDWKILQKLYMK